MSRGIVFHAQKEARFILVLLFNFCVCVCVCKCYQIPVHVIQVFLSAVKTSMQVPTYTCLFWKKLECNVINIEKRGQKG